MLAKSILIGHDQQMPWQLSFNGAESFSNFIRIMLLVKYIRKSQFDTNVMYQLAIHSSQSSNKNSLSESVWPSSLSLFNPSILTFFSHIPFAFFDLAFLVLHVTTVHHSCMLESGSKSFKESLSVLSVS